VEGLSDKKKHGNADRLKTERQKDKNKGNADRLKTERQRDRKRDELHHHALTHDRRRKKYISFDNFGTEISISQNG